MKTTATMMLFVLAGLVLGACKSSEMATGPAARSMEQQLIDQHITAQGGLETLRSIQSLRMTGETYIPMAGMSMPLTIYQKRPAKMRVEVNVTAMNMEIVNGYDGETAWTVNPMQGGTQKLSGEEARNLKEQADLDGILVDHAAKGYSVEYVGEEEVKGGTTQKLRVLRPDSSEIFIYLDAASHLQIKVEGKGNNPMSGARSTVESYLSDYRAVDGVMMPFAIEVFFDGEVFQKVTLSDIETNVEIDDAVFAYPKK